MISQGDIMPSLMTIRHVTTYRYRLPVAFGEHRMMLRPRESLDQRVIEASLQISPQPSSLRFAQDSFGNHIGIAQFSRRSKELCFESIVCLEHLPAGLDDFEFDDIAGAFCGYSADEMPDLARYIERHDIDPENRVAHWVEQFLPGNGSKGAFELLSKISQGIKNTFRYRRREAKGIQQPAETIRLGHGSCRDFAVLLIEASRALGFAARFASGYLAIPLGGWDETRGSARGSTHAWAQVYLPETGWVAFDPTSGGVGNVDLVTVAVARDPRHTIPLHGTFIGRPSDHLGMDVEVSVTIDPPEAQWAAASPPLSVRPN
jgi:transglutaminase-like putative cysteine protease